MASPPRVPRKIDHLVLPTRSLSTARSRLSALGFTVAPDAVHPFGTENACVFLADGSYLEPLAIAQRETCEAEARDGNVFVARDQSYRFRRGEEGFSAVSLTSDDAKADRKHFRKHGISAGKSLKFSRLFEDTNGVQSKRKFQLAFAADLRAPDMFLFTCERRFSAETPTKLLQHANGAVALREVIAGEPNPSDFQYFLQEVLDQRLINAHSFGIEFETGNANFAVYNQDGLRAWYGITDGCHARGLRLRAFSVAVEDLGKLKKQLAENDIENREIANRIVVAPSPGQGYTIAFEQAG